MFVYRQVQQVQHVQHIIYQHFRYFVLIWFAPCFSVLCLSLLISKNFPTWMSQSNTTSHSPSSPCPSGDSERSSPVKSSAGTAWYSMVQHGTAWYSMVQLFSTVYPFTTFCCLKVSFLCLKVARMVTSCDIPERQLSYAHSYILVVRYRH